jgi:hypothetical protein
MFVGSLHSTGHLDSFLTFPDNGEHDSASPFVFGMTAWRPHQPLVDALSSLHEAYASRQPRRSAGYPMTECDRQPAGIRSEHMATHLDLHLRKARGYEEGEAEKPG